MRMDGRYTLAAGRDVVWGLLSDPLVLEHILPGCESFEAVAANEYRVTLFLRVGQISDRFIGTLHLERVIPFTGFDFQADGESPNGMVNSRGRIYLEEQDAAHTVLCYEADVYVGGRLAAIATRMLETTTRAFARRCLEALDAQVDTRTRIFTSSIAPTPPPAPAGMSVERLAGLRRVAVLIASLLAALWLVRGVDRRRTRRMARQLATALAAVQSESPAVAPAEDVTG